ncbi:hypothetical protein [Paraburkholderia xenovorans]
MHQLAFLRGVFEIDNTLDVYGKPADAYKLKSTAVRAGLARSKRGRAEGGGVQLKSKRFLKIIGLKFLSHHCGHNDKAKTTELIN